MTINESPQLIAIKQKYRQSLNEKADFIASWLEFESPTRGEFMELAAWLHKFAGSAGMYGYDELSERARRLMLQAEKALEREETSDAGSSYQALFEEMHANLSQLVDLMREAVT